MRSGIKVYLRERRRKPKDPLTIQISTRRLQKKRLKWS